MKRLPMLLLLLVALGLGVIPLVASPAEAMGPAPSWQLNLGAPASCVDDDVFVPGVEINVPGPPASERGVLSAPGFPNLGFTQDSNFTGVGTFGFTVFTDPFSLPANTPLTLSVTTYYGPNFTGGTAYVSTLTWDCTTGVVLAREEGRPEGRIIVKKVTLPVGAPAQAFSFDPSWGADFALAGGQSADSGLVASGVYSVAELALPAGWSLASAVCSDGSSPAAIGLSPDETVTCTFTNAYEPPTTPMCLGTAATIVGTAGADTLNGTAGADVIAGLQGNDTINGLGGDDRICGGAGADTISGDAGNDRIRGGGGDDALRGGAGNDRLAGGGGIDLADGGRGADSCLAETTTACE